MLLFLVVPSCHASQSVWLPAKRWRQKRNKKQIQASHVHLGVQGFASDQNAQVRPSFFFLNIPPTPTFLELLSGINGVKSPIVDGSEGSLDGNEGSVDSIDGSLEPRIGDTNEQGNTDSDDSEYGDESDYYDDATDDYDYNYDTEDAVDEGSGSDYSDTYEAAEEDAGDDYDFDYAAEDNIEVDVPLDLPLGKKYL